MMIARVTSGTLDDAQTSGVNAIIDDVERLVDRLETDLQFSPLGFASELDSASDALKAAKVVTTYEIESKEHYFGVDFVLSGTTAIQSIFGSTQEWTKGDVDSALGKVGEKFAPSERDSD